jgi:hypothetical protein
VLLVVAATALHAQAKVGIFGSFGAERAGVANQNWKEAGTVGLYYGFANLGPAAFSVDARADLSPDVNNYLFGPRLALRLPGFPLKPYGEFIAGIANYTTISSNSKNITDIAYRGVLGLDTTILPRIDWRVVDASFGHIENGTSNALTLTSGLVVRF